MAIRLGEAGKDKERDTMTEPRRPAANDTGESAPAWTLTAFELECMVGRAVRQALTETPGPLLVDKQDVARQLNCSPAHVDHLRQRGLPIVKVGGLIRFEPARVLAWLREFGAA